MFNVKVGVVRLCSVVCLLAIAACAPMTKVKDVTADKMGYMTKHFSSQSVNAEVVKAISGKAGIKEIYRELRVSYTLETTTVVGGGKILLDGMDIYHPLDGGYVQRLAELSANGIPVSLGYFLNYGLVWLRMQSVPLQHGVANPMFAIKEISRFDAIPDRVGQEFSLSLSTGYAQVASTLVQSRWSCKTTKVGMASVMQPNLKGRAIDVSCEITNGNAGSVSGRNAWVFLEDYGVPITIESVTANGKNAYKITEIKLEN